MTKNDLMFHIMLIKHFQLVYCILIQCKISQNAVPPYAITYKMWSVQVQYFQEDINCLILNDVPSVAELRKVKAYPMPANIILQVLGT